MTDGQCRDFELARGKAVDVAEQLRSLHGDNSSEYLAAQRAIDAYGEPSIDNGVTVDIGNTGKFGGVTSVDGAAGAATEDYATGQNINVTFGAKTLGAGLPALLAHEGSHVADGSDWIRSGFSAAMNPTSYAFEVRAYQVQADIGQGLGWSFQLATFAGSAPNLLDISGWAPGNRNNAINAILRQHYGLSSTDPRRAFRRRVAR